MGKNRRNIFRRSSKVRLSGSSNKTAGSGKSVGSQENASNELDPTDIENKKNIINSELETNPEHQEENGELEILSKNAKLDRRKIKDKAKQISENNRSLKRKKKKNVVRQILSGFQQPKDNVPSSNGEKENRPISPAQNLKQKDQIRSSGRNISRGGPKRQSVGRNEDIVKENMLSAQNNAEETRNGGEFRSPSRMAKEEIYQSRKLLIRQMQGMIAKDQHKNNRQVKSNRNERRQPGEVVSEYDSWSDLEENFAKGFLLEIT